MRPMRHRRTSTFATCVATLALLFHTVLAALHAPIAFASAVGPQFDAASGLFTVVICTPSGFKRVAVDADGRPVEQHQPVDPQQTCPHCAAGCGGCFAKASPDQALTATAFGHAHALKRVLALTAGRAALTDHNRDPPRSV